MITDLLINILMAVPYGLLILLEPLDVQLSLDSSVFNTFKDILLCVDYVLPVQVMLICFGIKIAVRIWQLPYAIILRVKSFIPTMGG